MPKKQASSKNKGDRQQKCTTVVSAALQQQDVMDLIFPHLSIKYVLLSSLVCRAFLRHIDSVRAHYFNKNLRWWSFYHQSAFHDLPITFNAVTQQYEHKHRVFGGWETVWLTHVVPVVGARVHMRMNLRIRLDEVNLIGRAADIAKIKQQGVVTVDALEWEITEVILTSAQSDVCRGSTANVVMVLVSYVHSLRLVTLQMLKSVVVTFENVPVLKHMLSHRQLCVINSNRKCMHCLQRACRWKSLEVKRAEHRVLCSVCMDELFIDERSMHRRWKIKDLPLECVGGVRRSVFIPCSKYSVNLMHKHRVCVLKTDVLAFLGFESCTELLQKQSAIKNTRNVFKHLLLSTRWF